MNSLEGREWELYDLENIGGSTEYDNLLINKDIDNYFNDIINKPIVKTNSNIGKLNGNFDKIYEDYIEPNFIFIVVLIGIIIFLTIRHYIKDFDTFDSNNYNNMNNANNTNNTNNTNDLNEKILEKNKSKSKKLEIEKIKLINYKRELDKEKQQILSIIDELSNMNDMESNVGMNSNPKPKPNINYVKEQDINAIYSDNYNNYNNYNNQVGFYNNQMELGIKTRAHNDNNINVNMTKYADDNVSNYYDMNKMQNDKTNEIDGLYIEPPFM
jgi:hypothetical protein